MAKTQVDKMKALIVMDFDKVGSKKTEKEMKAYIDKMESEYLAKIGSKRKSLRAREKAQLIKSLREDTNLIVKEEKKRQGILARMRKGFGGSGGFGVKISQIAGYGAAYKVVQLFTQAVTTAIQKTIEFERGFDKLQARIGATNTEMISLRASIKDVASSSIFTIEQVTQAAEAMGKLGFNAASLEKILPTVSTVAIALGEDMQGVGAEIGKVIRTFGMMDEMASQVGDRLVQAFNNSALSLQTFSTAFAYVGANAVSSNTSFNELASAMEILANRGFKASKIGTGLRKVMAQLADEGTTLADVIQQVADKQLSYGQASAIMGRIGANQLFTLAEASKEFEERTTKGLDAYGEALQRAAIAQDNFGAEWDILWARVWATLARSGTEEPFEQAIGDLRNMWGTISRGLEGNVKHWIDLHKDFRDKFYAVWDGDDATIAATITGLGISKATVGTNIHNAAVEYIKKLNKERIEDINESAMTDHINSIKKEAARREKEFGVDARNAYLDSILFHESDPKVKEELRKARIRETDGFLKESKDAVDAYDEIIDSVRLRIDKKEKIHERDIERMERAIEERQAIKDRLCKLGIDPRTVDPGLGSCKKSRAGSRQSYRFEEDTDIRLDYVSKKEALQTQMNNPNTSSVEKQKLYGRLIELEKWYNQELYRQNEESYNKHARLAAKAATEQEKSGHLAIMYRNEKAMTSAQEKIVKADAEFKNKIFEASVKSWEEDAMLKAQFGKDTEQMRLDMMNAKTVQEKRQIQADYQKVVDKYYDEQIAALKKFIQDQETLIEIAKYMGQDTTGAEEDLYGFRAMLIELEGDQIKAKRKGKKAQRGDTDLEEWGRDEWIAQAMEWQQQLTDIYFSYSQMRLDELRREADEEIAILTEKYDKLGGVINAAEQAEIISAEQAQAARERLNERKIQKENEVAKKLFEAEKKQERQKMISDIAQGVANAWIQAMNLEPPLNLIVGAANSALVLAQGAIALKAIDKKKFIPKKYADGGIVYGRSHAQGGVPFTVNGQGGYEMEGGEYVVNKDATARHFELLERINGKKSDSSKKYFEDGGVVLDGTSSTNTLELMLEAMSQPVRAYVTNQDLVQSESERKTLSEKVSY